VKNCVHRRDYVQALREKKKKKRKKKGKIKKQTFELALRERTFEINFFDHNQIIACKLGQRLALMMDIPQLQRNKESQKRNEKKKVSEKLTSCRRLIHR
jgi:hypothetical protein